MNETLKTIAQRYSCRDYDGKLPEQAALDAIAQAAIQAPSAMNRQPWKLVVVTDKALMEDMDAEGMRMLSEMEDKSTYERFMSRGGTLFYNAPCMFLVLEQDGRDLDAGIVCENIALAAASLGLGSCICAMASIPLTGPKAAEYSERLGIKDGWEFGIAILVGNATATGTPHETDPAKIRYVK